VLCLCPLHTKIRFCAFSVQFSIVASLCLAGIQYVMQLMTSLFSLSSGMNVFRVLRASYKSNHDLVMGFLCVHSLMYGIGACLLASQTQKLCYRSPKRMFVKRNGLRCCHHTNILKYVCIALYRLRYIWGGRVMSVGVGEMSKQHEGLL